MYEQRLKAERLWEPKQLHADKAFFPFVEQWCRLPKEVALYQSLKVFEMCLDTALSNLMWTQRWPFFEKEVGLKTSWGFACILKSWIKTVFVLRKLEAAKQGWVQGRMEERDWENHTRGQGTCCSLGKCHFSRHHAAPRWRPRAADCLETHSSYKRTKPLIRGWRTESRERTARGAHIELVE